MRRMVAGGGTRITKNEERKPLSPKKQGPGLLPSVCKPHLGQAGIGPLQSLLNSCNGILFHCHTSSSVDQDVHLVWAKQRRGQAQSGVVLAAGKNPDYRL